jgi:hypothetical protein
LDNELTLDPAILNDQHFLHNYHYAKNI